MTNETKESKYHLTIAEKFATSFIVIHIFSMIVYPLFKSKFNFTWIHQTWMDWQTYNAAFIALIASFIAYKATVYNYTKERENNFFATKALLPHALDNLCSYTKDCAKINLSLISRARGGSSSRSYFQQYPNIIPIPDKDAMAVFTDCIRYSDRNLGKYLAKILEEIQVINARLESLRDNDISHNNIPEVSETQLMYIAGTRFKLESLFPFARNEVNYFEEQETNENGLRTIISTRLSR
ncbi:hypothetical protein [Delftia sp. DS1230]|uniref:hypothetical protein n=1 Tax=Delftia sp. DS1230 TaxID=3153805 RepID=UPI0032D9511E